MSRAQDERGLRALVGLEQAPDLVVGVVRIAGVERVDNEARATRRRADRSADPVDRQLLRRLAGAEPRRDPPAHRHLAADALDSADELEPGQETAVVERDRVGHADGAAGRYEGGLQHVRVLDVLALHAEVNLRRELEGAAALRIEKAREDRLGVEARERQPVDRAVAGDEGARATVADEGVVADRRVAVVTGRRVQARARA